MNVFDTVLLFIPKSVKDRWAKENDEATARLLSTGKFKLVDNKIIYTGAQP